MIGITIEEDMKASNENVKDWIKSKIGKGGWKGYYENWPKDKKGNKIIWDMSYNEVIDFLMIRRSKAIDPSEYYDTLPYLTKDISPIDLEITFTNFKKKGTKENSTDLKKSRKMRTIGHEMKGLTNRRRRNKKG